MDRDHERIYEKESPCYLILVPLQPLCFQTSTNRAFGFTDRLIQHDLIRQRSIRWFHTEWIDPLYWLTNKTWWWWMTSFYDANQISMKDRIQVRMALGATKPAIQTHCKGRVNYIRCRQGFLGFKSAGSHSDGSLWSSWFLDIYMGPPVYLSQGLCTTICTRWANRGVSSLEARKNGGKNLLSNWISTICTQ